jgi:NAD(P)-dependent dehydrogenase (short-subunit alcohol dehydrogenase family)
MEVGMNILITGANRGIGLGFVKHYLAGGNDVWACYRSDRGGLVDIKNPKLHEVRWDVREDQGRDFPDRAGIPARLDVLINNAGVYGGEKQSLADVTPKDMLETFDINCVSPLRVVKLLWPRVAQAKGVIANMSSKMGSSADNSSGGYYAYRASKAALVIVSKSLAVDLGDHGIHVITLHPGWVRTDMTDHTGLIDVSQSVAGLARVIARAGDYAPGAFVAYDGTEIPY